MSHTLPTDQIVKQPDLLHLHQPFFTHKNYKMDVKEKEAKAQHLASLINQLEQISMENTQKLGKSSFNILQFDAHDWPVALQLALQEDNGEELVHLCLADNANKGYKILAKKFGESLTTDDTAVWNAVMHLSQTPKIACLGLFPLIPYSLLKWYADLDIRNAQDRIVDNQLKREVLLTILLNLSSPQPTPSSQLIPGLLPLESPVILLGKLSSFNDFVAKLHQDISKGLEQDAYLSTDAQTRYNGTVHQLASMDELDLVVTDGTSPLLLLFILQNIWKEPSLHPILKMGEIWEWGEFLKNYKTPENHLHTYQTEMVLSILAHLQTRCPVTHEKPSDIIPLSLLDSCECIRTATLQVFEAMKPPKAVKAQKCMNVGCPNREPFPGCFIPCSCGKTIYCTPDCQWEHFERCNHVSEHAEQDLTSLMQMMPMLIEAFQKVKQDEDPIPLFSECIDLVRVDECKTNPAVPIMALATFGKVKYLLNQTPVDIKTIEESLERLLLVYPMSAEALFLRGKAQFAIGSTREALMDYYSSTQLLRLDWRKKQGEVTLQEAEHELLLLTESLLGVAISVEKSELGRPDIHGVLICQNFTKPIKVKHGVYGQVLQFNVGQVSDGTGGTLEDHGDPTSLESISRIFIQRSSSDNLSSTRRRMCDARRHLEVAISQKDSTELETALLIENRHLTIPWTEFTLTPILSVFHHSETGKEVDVEHLNARQRAAFWRACSEVCVRRGLEKDALDWLLKARSCREEWVSSVLLAHAVETGSDVEIEGKKGDELQEFLLLEYLERLKEQGCDHVFEEVEYPHVAASLSRLLLKRGEEEEARKWFIQSKLHAPLTRFLWKSMHGNANLYTTQEGIFDKELEKASLV
jgi:hypothetical protein